MHRPVTTGESHFRSESNYFHRIWLLLYYPRCMRVCTYIHSVSLAHPDHFCGDPHIDLLQRVGVTSAVHPINCTVCGYFCSMHSMQSIGATQASCRSLPQWFIYRPVTTGESHFRSASNQLHRIWSLLNIRACSVLTSATHQCVSDTLHLRGTDHSRTWITSAVINA